MAFPHHASVGKFFKDAARRVEDAHRRGEWADYEGRLRAFLAAPGTIDPRAVLELGWLGHLHGAAAVDAYARADATDLARSLSSATGFKTLELRLHSALGAGSPDVPDNRPRPFQDSLSAALPCALSMWPLAEAAAVALMRMLEKDQRLRMPTDRRVSNGSIDAFLAGLLTEGLISVSPDLRGRYAPIEPVEPCYATLLESWRALDPGAFAAAMFAAAEFHIRRSKPSTDRTRYEFDTLFVQVFPVELLAPLALRQRLGLPSYEAGHALVDGPWRVIESLPTLGPDPLVEALEARLTEDYPTSS